jgi:hypothetical protein
MLNKMVALILPKMNTLDFYSSEMVLFYKDRFGDLFFDRFHEYGEWNSPPFMSSHFYTPKKGILKKYDMVFDYVKHSYLIVGDRAMFMECSLIETIVDTLHYPVHRFKDNH